MKLIVKVTLLVFIACFVLSDVTFGKKTRKPPKRMNNKQKFDFLFEKMAYLQRNLSILMTKFDNISRGSGGVHIHSRDSNVQHIHDHNQNVGGHIHMHMHIDSGCKQDSSPSEDDSMHRDADDQGFLHAHCEMKKAPELGESHGNVHGRVHMKQSVDGGLVHIDANLVGFDMVSQPRIRDHAFHIHNLGDISEGCSNLGPPFDHMEEGYASHNRYMRRAGDFGNITCNDVGNAVKHFTSNRISLFGDKSVVGRSIVVHALPYTDGSKGSAGIHIACCVIGRSHGTTDDDEYWTHINKKK